MPTRLLFHCLVLSIAAAFSGGNAWAMGFARVAPSATLGAPLDFAVGVRLDAAEVLQSECVSAEVWIGDNQVPRSAVTTALERSGGAPTVRVRTSVRVDEPIVTVNITAGCEARISRRFTLFADPPGLAADLPIVAVPERALAEAPAPQPVERTLPRRPSEQAAAVRPGPPAPRVARRPDAGARAAAPAKAPTTPRVVAAAPARAPKPASARAEPRNTGARLRLDAPSVTFVSDRVAEEAAERREAALNTMRVAAGVAQAAANAASSRVATVEASVDALKRESQANRETMAKLQKSLVQADERGRWTPWLLATVVALLGLAGWLYSRLRQAEHENQQAWWNSAQVGGGPAPDVAAAASAEPVPGPETEPAPPAASSRAPARVQTPPLPVPEAQRQSFVVTPDVGARAHMDDAAVPASQATQPLPPGLVVPDSPLRDVSIEELLDVEQQAEFFVVLGQDDAAVDLLMGHLRSTGGASPLPYLKLLEIYHRRNDQAAYERMRRRFNERFNAVAPEWSAGLLSGRSLESYPTVLAQIQHSWPRPVDAMADLETLLFRTDGRELFDLPAYRDVLFLFTLARDLQEMAQHDPPRVDVLLPLHQGQGQADAAGPASGRPGADFDLSLRVPDVDIADPLAPEGGARNSDPLGFFSVEPRKGR